MNCSDCQDLLSEYIDGELGTDSCMHIRAHLSACRECNLLHQDLDQIVHMSKELPLLAPQSAVWAHIEQEIQELTNVPVKRQLGAWARFWSYQLQLSLSMPQMAGVMALLVMAIVVVGSLSYQPQQAILMAPARTTLVAKPLAHVMNPEEAELRSAIDRLTQAVEQRRQNWDPQMQELFDRNLAIVDRSLAECRQLLLRNPHDQIAQEMMIVAYKEKLRLLEQFSTL
ncbi:MAG: zf-HC2 domain-containing protein [Acidobacteriota bacterium]